MESHGIILFSLKPIQQIQLSFETQLFSNELIRDRYVNRFSHLWIFIIFFFCSSNSLAGGSKDYISFSTALFDFLQNDVTSLEARIEYRVNSVKWQLKPFAGLMANTDGGEYIYSGVFYEIPITKFLNLVPSFAPGLYFKNNSKDLHFVVEFRTQLEAIFVLPNKLRAGVSFNHISNASLGKSNPGVESIAITFQLPVPW
jgi:lipid A 3-O-deacylase